MNSKISFLIGGDNLKRRIFNTTNIHYIVLVRTIKTNCNLRR